MDNVRLYRILLSMPGDVVEEVKHIESAIAEFNRTTGEAQDIVLRPLHWSSDSFPQVGDRPQEILNQQIVRKSDAVIAVFASRFGSDTGKFQSGTEEEIEEMIAGGKPVFLYFSTIPKDPSTIDIEQFNRVQAFKEKYRKHALYGTFSSLGEIEKKVHRDLTLYFLSQQSQQASAKAVPLSDLCLSSRPSEEAVNNRLVSYQIDQDQFTRLLTSLSSSISQKISYISNIRIQKPAQQSDAGRDPATNAAFKVIEKFNRDTSIIGEQVEVSAKDQEATRRFAKDVLGVELPQDFFKLGDLNRSRLSLSPFGGSNLIGDQASQKKFSEICDVERKICQFNELKAWLSQIENVFFLKVVLENRGTRFDEDISVDLYFPADTVVPHGEIAAPGFEASQIVTDRLLSFLFRPVGDADVEPFAEYPEEYARTSMTLPPQMLSRTEAEAQRKRAYDSWMDRHFLFEVNREPQRVVLTARFSYLRQHTAIYFPTPILLSKVGFKGSYRIRSKHSAKVFTGEFEVV